MALPLDSPDPMAADLPIDPKQLKDSKLAALGFASLFAYYIVILVVTLRKVPWESVQQIASDLSGQVDSIVAIAIFAAANALLAILAAKIFSLYRWAFRCV